MKTLKTLVIISFILIIQNTSEASSLMGSLLTWQSVGQDSFIVKLELYRDCNGTNFSNAQINFNCKSTGAPITVKNVSTPTPTDITPYCDETCTKCSDPGCSFPYGIEKYVYNIGIIVLSNAGTCCEILMSYSSCCRSSTITTGAEGESFYTEAWLNRCIEDNSPSFTNPPVAIVCAGQDVLFCVGITDYDMDSKGHMIDSLSYSLVDPLGTNSTPLSFDPPYSKYRPLHFYGFPDENLPFPRGMHLNQITGEIMFRPMQVEQTIMAVEIGEYRNNVLIGQTRIDFQIIIIECPQNNSPTLGGSFSKQVNAGNNITFSITTDDSDTGDSLTISWNNSIPGAIWSSDNLTAKHPTANFTWTTDSTLTKDSVYYFIATVKDDACPVNGSSFRIYEILVKPSITGMSKTSKKDQIKIYPNPVKDNITIEFAKDIHSQKPVDNPQYVKIEIIDALGNIVRSLSDYDGRSSFNINLNGLHNGYYFMKVQLDEESFVKKFVLRM